MAMKVGFLYQQRLCCLIGTPGRIHCSFYFPKRQAERLHQPSVPSGAESPALGRIYHQAVNYTKTGSGNNLPLTASRWISYGSNFCDRKQWITPDQNQQRGYRATKRSMALEPVKSDHFPMCIEEGNATHHLHNAPVMIKCDSKVQSRKSGEEINFIKELLNEVRNNKSYKGENDIEKVLQNDLQAILPQHNLQSAVVPCRVCGDDIVIRQEKDFRKYGDKTVGIRHESIKLSVGDPTVGSSCHFSEESPVDGAVLSSSPMKADYSQADAPKTSPSTQGDRKRRMLEHLALMHERLSVEMPEFFEHSHDYSMYSSDIEFDNRIMKVKTRGLPAYRATVQSLKYFSTAYLVNAHMEVLRLTIHLEDNSIQARWRVVGVPIYSYVLKPLAKTRKYRYFDAFSTLYVGEDGLIKVHKLDKYMPDTQKEKVPSVLTRVGMALGLIRSPGLASNWMDSKPACKSS